MKTSLGILALAAAGFVVAAMPSPAKAQTYPVGPWCFETRENLTPDCSQPNLEQCRLTSLNGRAGRCYRNPDYRAGRIQKRRH
jgi:hypothetical protein